MRSDLYSGLVSVAMSSRGQDTSVHMWIVIKVPFLYYVSEYHTGSQDDFPSSWKQYFRPTPIWLFPDNTIPSNWGLC